MLTPITRTLTPKLIDQLDQCLRESRYSPHAVETYVRWVRGYICFHHFRHPANMGTKEIRLFLAYLVDEHNISYTTYIHALCALLFLYKKLLKVDIGWIESGLHPSCPRRVTAADKRKQLEMPLLSADAEHRNIANPAASSSLLPQAYRTKSKIAQKHFYAPGNADSYHAI